MQSQLARSRLALNEPVGYGEGTEPDDWQIYVTRRAAGQASWSKPDSLGTHDHADRHPALAYARDGTLVAAWDSKVLTPAGVNTQIQSSAYTAAAGWSAPQAVSEDDNSGAEYPRLGLDGSGKLTLVRQDNRSADWRWRLLLTQRADDGSWDTGSVLPGRGNNLWPQLAGGTLVFVSSRNAQRLQRDHTDQIFAVGISGR
mgnify:FL=1